MPIDNKTLPIFQQAHARNEQLANYIQITNAGVWGFLAIAFMELFQQGIILVSSQMVVFSFLLIASMLAWLFTRQEFQKSIEEGYIRILNCEIILGIDEKISLKHNLINKIPSLIENINDKDKEQKEYQNLINYLETKQYIDHIHRGLNCFAAFLLLLGLVLLSCNFSNLFSIC